MAHGDDTDDSGGLGSGRRTAIERSRGRSNLYAITDSDECSVVIKYFAEFILIS